MSEQLVANPVGQEPLQKLLSLQLAAAHGRTLHFHPGSMRHLLAAEPAWQVLVVKDVLRQIALLDLFESADRLCAVEDAQMLVLDDFTLELTELSSGHAPLLSEFLAMASRCGWRVMFEQAQGSRRLLRLHRARAPALRLARVGGEQSADMRKLFERVFGHSMSEAEWQWKYGAGQGFAVGLYRGQEMLAHYGGLTRPILLMGRRGLGCQVGDVMVAPEANSGLGRRLPLHDVAATLFEAEVGWGKRHDVAFGFPSSRHMRVAERLNLYAPVDGIAQLAWQALPTDNSDLGRAELLDAASLLENTMQWQALQALWAHMARELAASIIAVRDPGWLRYRYGQRPGVSHSLLLLREADHAQAVGAIVLRAHPDHLELLDLIAPPERFPRLLMLARAFAGVSGLPRVQMWVTQSHAHLLQDVNDPPRCETLDVTIPVSIHTPGLAPADLKHRWFLTGGDTDFR